MLDLEEQIHRYAEAAGDRVGAGAKAVRTVSPRSRPAWPLALAAGVIALAVVAGLVLRSQAGNDDPADDGPPPSVDEPGDGGGTWDEIPPAPIAARFAEVLVATDDELIVWGGYGDADYADGAAYSFADGTWRTMAPSPLAARNFAVAVWTGEEVLIWGGEGPDGTSLEDGAAYDPAADTWRMLPSSGGAVGRSEVTGTVWTGQEMVLVGVSSAPNAFLPSDVVAYDPADDQWRTLDAFPGPQPFVNVHDTVWTGTEVLVTSSPDEAGDLVIWPLDPSRGTWGEPVDTQAGGYGGPPVWTGAVLVIPDLDPHGVVFDPATGELTELAPSGDRDGEVPTTAVSERVVIDGDRWLDPTTGAWHDVASTGESDRFGPDALAHDGTLVVWGGDRLGPAVDDFAFSGRNDGLIWRPPS